ncbi:hypothetical protein ACT16_16035 [Mycobacterium heckeshornense]|nr:hypothetical protein ACT16_16035 [Mycobacterium heckeshornense]
MVAAGWYDWKKGNQHRLLTLRPTSTETPLMALAIGALLALGSALCVAIGDVVQQRAAHRVTEGPVGHVQLLEKLLRDRCWQLGALVPSCWTSQTR